MYKRMIAVAVAWIGFFGSNNLGAMRRISRRAGVTAGCFCLRGGVAIQKVLSHPEYQDPLSFGDKVWLSFSIPVGVGSMAFACYNFYQDNLQLMHDMQVVRLRVWVEEQKRLNQPIQLSPEEDAFLSECISKERVIAAVKACIMLSDDPKCMMNSESGKMHRFLFDGCIV